MKNVIFLIFVGLQCCDVATAITKLGKLEHDYKAKFQQLETENKEMREENLEMKSEVEQLKQQLSQVLAKLESDETNKKAQVATDAKQDHLIKDLVRDVTKHAPIVKSNPAVQNTVTAHACLFDVMVLECDPTETLFITEAFYGSYASTCSGDCCAPDTSDCRVSISEENSDEWLTIRANCNYESGCVHQYQGHELIGCNQVLADYMELTYSCASDVGEPPASEIPLVAFTAYDTSSRYYSTGSRFQFPYTSLNIGDAYDTFNDEFTCPYDGVYVFHYHVQSDSSDLCYAELRVNDQPVNAAYADNVSSHYSQASNTAYVTCAAGNRVWVEAASGSYCYGGSNRLTTFSGNFLGFSDVSVTFGYED